jgi:hypothetical protein
MDTLEWTSTFGNDSIFPVVSNWSEFQTTNVYYLFLIYTSVQLPRYLEALILRRVDSRSGTSKARVATAELDALGINT